MLKLKTALALSLALSFTTACDGGEKKADDKKADAKKDDKKAGDKKDDKKADAKADEKKAPEPAAVEPSADMKKFLDGFDGTSDKVAAQLKEFGSTDEIKGDDMGMWNLKDPKVTASKDGCETFEAASGMTTRTYDVCWAEGKIKSIADKGVK